MEESWFQHYTFFLFFFFFPFPNPGTATEIECSSSALLYTTEKVTASGVYLHGPWAEQKKKKKKRCHMDTSLPAPK